MSKEEDGLVGIVEMGGGNQPPLPREHPEAKLQQNGHQVTPGSRSDRDMNDLFSNCVMRIYCMQTKRHTNAHSYLIVYARARGKCFGAPG